MTEFTAIELIQFFIITWSIGLFPPLLIRYVFLKRPISKKLAIGISAFLWLFNIFLFTMMESKSKTHAVLLLIAYISFWILHREKKISTAKASATISKTEFPAFTVRNSHSDVGKTAAVFSRWTNISGVRSMKYIWPVLVIIILTVVSTIYKSTFREYLGKEPDIRSRAFLTKIASEMNKNLPMMINKETEWCNTGALEGIVVNNYRLVNISASELSLSDFTNSVRPIIIKAACSTPQTRENFLKKGVNIRYTYYDKMGLFLCSIDVTEADCGLSSMYEDGRGVPQNYAQNSIWLRKAAEQGDSEAQSSLSFMYEDGRGVPQNYAQAGIWLRKAAEQGLSKAQRRLGDMYKIGTKLVPQDYGQAVAWYRKAAEQGDSVAQSSLSTMYYSGEGMEKNLVVAYMLSNLAVATAGDKDDIKLRDTILEEMTPAQIAEGQALAAKWKLGDPLPR